MHTATDNANELITKYTRLANSAARRKLPRKSPKSWAGPTLLTRAKPFETRSNTMTDTHAIAEGRVARVVGPVVDVEFPPDRIPPLYNALTVEVNLAGQGEASRPSR